MSRPSSWLLSALPFAIALAFLPGWSFYYDVIPKAAAVLVSVGLLCLWAAWDHEILLLSWTSRAGRWNGILCAAGIALAVATAATSPMASLAWTGSEWRRLGALTSIAIILAAYLAGTLAGRSVENRVALLRGLCLAGSLASLYGIAQYFGYDPWLDSSLYHFGEGEYQIVRPPGPIGHSNYLAAFLLWPVFCGVGLWRSGGRFLGGVTAVSGAVAILLCGSRGAWAGLAAGAILLLVLERPSARIVARGLLLVAVVAALFYFSPFGDRLRARVFWIGEDAAGGSRVLLWRDAWNMSATRPWSGFGPDTFAAEFPRYQSEELSRSFPDFYHESPHNLFLDALVGQGWLGVLLWVGWFFLGAYGAWRAIRGHQRRLGVTLLAGLAASLVAHQFAVLVIPTAFALLLGVGLLASLDEARAPVVPVRRGLIAVPCIAAACWFFFSAQSMLRADLALGTLQRADANTAMGLWREAKETPVSANLYFSRRWTENAARTMVALDKLRWSQLAGEAAVAATHDPEQQQNAWYNLAILQASANDATAVEKSLRAAIQAAPTWFKPHWMLARLLAATGRIEEAQREARLALDLNGRRDAEVIATTEEILGSDNPKR
jgi:O-antigen ligase